MSHTSDGKQNVLARVRRIRGQVEAIQRALEKEAGCAQVMHLSAGVRGAVTGLVAEVAEDHVRTHLVDDEKSPGALDTAATEQLLAVVRTYLKQGLPCLQPPTLSSTITSSLAKAMTRACAKLRPQSGFSAG